MFVDPNIPTNLGASTNEDRIIAGRFADAVPFESPLNLETFRETKSVGSRVEPPRGRVMIFGVVHAIHDRAAWDATEHDAAPPGVSLLYTVHAQDGKRALCVWEAPTAQTLQSLLDSWFASSAVNDVFPLNENDFTKSSLKAMHEASVHVIQSR